MEKENLKNPVLVAVWPGMGHVAINAGIYMLAKFQMRLLAEFSTRDLFDIESVAVSDGIIGRGVFPRSRLFVWHNPTGTRDVIVFIGEAQPPTGKYAFCQKLIDVAASLNVERVYTFAAMATAMRPEHESRIFGVATDKEILDELKRLELDIVEEGQIGGLNGILLSVAAERDMHGACLMGEIPQIFSQFPFPKASQRVLEVFSTMTGVEIDLSELAEQAQAVESRLGEILSQAEQAIATQGHEESEGFSVEPQEEEQTLSPEDEKHIEALFEEAAKDRSRAYELKRELDRLNVFREYEDRFLDLFKASE